MLHQQDITPTRGTEIPVPPKQPEVGQWLEPPHAATRERLRRFAGRILRALFRVEIRGLDNYGRAGPRFIIVANHAS